MHTNTQADRTRPAALEQVAAQDPSFTASDDDERVQLITFANGGEQYAVDIQDVQEIACLSQVTLGMTAGPHAECVAFMLHGKTVPMLDLRPRGRTTLTPMHVVVVVQNRWGLLGLLADQMPDVVAADLLSLDAVPRLLRLRDCDVPAGDLTIEGRLITLVDPSELRIDLHEPLSFRTLQRVTSRPEPSMQDPSLRPRPSLSASQQAATRKKRNDRSMSAQISLFIRHCTQKLFA